MTTVQTLCLPQCSDDLPRSVSLPSHPDLLAEKLQTRSILTLHLVSFQGVRSAEPADHVDTGLSGLRRGPKVMKVLLSEKHNIVTLGLLHLGLG